MFKKIFYIICFTQLLVGMPKADLPSPWFFLNDDINLSKYVYSNLKSQKVKYYLIGKVKPSSLGELLERPRIKKLQAIADANSSITSNDYVEYRRVFVENAYRFDGVILNLDGVLEVKDLEIDLVFVIHELYGSRKLELDRDIIFEMSQIQGNIANIPFQHGSSYGKAPSSNALRMVLTLINENAPMPTEIIYTPPPMRSK